MKEPDFLLAKRLKIWPNKKERAIRTANLRRVYLGNYTRLAGVLLPFVCGQEIWGRELRVVPLLAIGREIRDLPDILLIPQAQAADGL